MKICRFNQDRIGVIEGDQIYDITEFFDLTVRWPVPAYDIVIEQLPKVISTNKDAFKHQPKFNLESVRLESPVANPGKIIGAPVNYRAHIDEANADEEINTGKTYGWSEVVVYFWLTSAPADFKSGKSIKNAQITRLFLCF